jgi:hypothetical protein
MFISFVEDQTKKNIKNLEYSSTRTIAKRMDYCRYLTFGKNLKSLPLINS